MTYSERAKKKFDAMSSPCTPVLLCLASSSPRRRKILEQVGVPFRIHAPSVEEVRFVSDPSRTVSVNAQAKAEVAHECFPDGAIVAADTVLEFEGRCIGKPASLDEARKLMAMFSGKVHTVLTGLALWASGVEVIVHVETSTVQFRKLDAKDIEAYLYAVNPLDKAGGYDIDQCSEIIIDSFQGSRTNVMGLPIEVVMPWLNQQKII